eukprot:m.665840 g.665840  ORF g.665840 m.665840 type:complete len:190 (-) comp22748_c0_seq22:612-1181(-)
MPASSNVITKRMDLDSAPESRRIGDVMDSLGTWETKTRARASAACDLLATYLQGDRYGIQRKRRRTLHDDIQISRHREDVDAGSATVHPTQELLLKKYTSLDDVFSSLGQRFPGVLTFRSLASAYHVAAKEVVVGDNVLRLAMGFVREKEHRLPVLQATSVYGVDETSKNGTVEDIVTHCACTCCVKTC